MNFFNYTNTTIFAIAAIVFLLLSSCEKPLDAAYEQDARIYFFERQNDPQQTRITNRSFSFLLEPSTVTRDTVFIKVKTMGNPAAHDRFTLGQAIAEGTNAVEGVDYDFIPGLIPAGEVVGNLPIILYRTERSKTTDLLLNLTIAETPDFKVGVIEDDRFTFTWSDKISKPGNWDTPNFGIVYIFGAYSEAKYRFIIDVLGIADFNLQTCARCPLVPGEYTYAAMLDFKAQLTEALQAYNRANPGNPIIDEITGMPISF